MQQQDVQVVHSCPAATLRNDALLEAMCQVKQAGKVRAIGYSGDGEAAGVAIELGVFDVVEMSLNFCDQQPLDPWLPQAARAGLGVLIKRPLANASWREPPLGTRPTTEPGRPYAARLAAMGLSPQAIEFDGSWAELALRFALFWPGVCCGIIGGINAEHVAENVHALEQGPLPDSVVRAIRALWAKHDDGSWLPHV
jgi:aryl-alcohol dehydrogenase-like predicted oxidoreductase